MFDLLIISLFYTKRNMIQIKNKNTGKLILEIQYLRYADLRYADLRYADLRYADLKYADLRYADLSGTDLRYADLRYANLSGANLSGAETDKRYIQVSCIGSTKKITTYCFEDDIIFCGCFKGNLKQFEQQVKETHKNNSVYLKEYLGFIKYLKSLI